MPLTEEQLRQRRHTLGASEIAAVAGLSPWKTAHDVWCEKLDLVESVSTLTTRAGDLAEAAIRQQYIEEEKCELAHFGTVIHPQHSWMSATPDFAVRFYRRVGEIKFVGFRLAFDWGTEPDAVPDYYRPQAEWQMEVCNADECDFAVWVGGPDFRIYRVKRERELAEGLRVIGEKFWKDHVLKRVPPRVDASESARRMLARWFPDSVPGKMLQATPEAERIAAELIRVRAEIEQAETLQKDKDGLENRLRELIGDAEGIIAPTWKATWKTNKAGRRQFLFKPFEKQKRAA